MFDVFNAVALWDSLQMKSAIQIKHIIIIIIIIIIVIIIITIIII